MFTIDDMPAWVREYSRFMMLLAIGMTLGLVALVLMTQMSLIEEAHSSRLTSYHLSHDLTNLRTQWSQAEPSKVQKRIKDAEQMLLRDFDHLTVWLQQLESHASSLGLRSKYRVLPTRTRVPELNDVEITPVSLKVFPEKSSVLTGAYEQYLKFLHGLSEDQIRVDLQEIQVQGGRGAEHMNVLIHVWVKITT